MIKKVFIIDLISMYSINCILEEFRINAKVGVEETNRFEDNREAIQKKLYDKMVDSLVVYGLANINIDNIKNDVNTNVYQIEARFKTPDSRIFDDPHNVNTILETISNMIKETLTKFEDNNKLGLGEITVHQPIALWKSRSS